MLPATFQHRRAVEHDTEQQLALVGRRIQCSGAGRTKHTGGRRTPRRLADPGLPALEAGLAVSNPWSLRSDVAEEDLAGEVAARRAAARRQNQVMIGQGLVQGRAGDFDHLEA